jgi:DNA-binding PadR family transcriptional regulator
MAKQCPCSGGTLDKLVHPAIFIVLSRGSLHGYEIATLLAKMPMFRGRRPDTTGVYRCLQQMEKRGYVASARVKSENGPGKRVFSVTAKGRDCLARRVQRTHRNLPSGTLRAAEQSLHQFSTFMIAPVYGACHVLSR